MSYTSPFKLLPFLKVETLNLESINYNLLRRKLLAEFELNDNQPLEVNGKIIGKTDALNVLEGLKDPEMLNQHISISKNKSLLDYLGGNNVDYIFNVNNHHVSIPEFVQEDFIEIVNKQIGQYYKANEFAKLRDVMSFPLESLVTIYLDKPLYETFYRRVKSDLAELNEIDEMEGTRDKLVALKGNQFLIEQKRAKCVNLLPEEFRYLIDQMALIMINISSDIFNAVKNKKYTLMLCRYVIILNCSKDYGDLARGNYKIISSDGGSGSKSSGKTSFWRYAILAFIVIRLILLLAR